jgi:hypothetical protein
VPVGKPEDSFPFTLETCPSCGYSLTGLPDTHDCPECGFFFERNARVFRRTKHPVREITLVVLYACFLLILVYKNPEPRLFILTAAFAVIAGWRLHASRRPSPMVIVSQTCVRIVDDDGTERVHDVEKLGKAHWSFITGWFTLQARDDLPLDQFEGALTGSNRHARQAVRLFNEAIRLRDEAET